MGWRERWERISLVLDGVLSGFIFGMVTTSLVVARSFKITIPIDYIIFFILAAAFGVAIFVWSIHKALKTG